MKHSTVARLPALQEQVDGLPTDYLRSLWLDEPLGRNGSEFYLADALGSTLALTDLTGTIATEYSYEPFGQTVATGTATTNPFDYTGRENDGTGLKYYRARYYHPGLQWFISEGPIEFRGGDVNLYVYARSSPLNFLDSLGLTSLTYDFSGQVLTVDPERPGEVPYTIPASSGVGDCMNQQKCANIQNRGPIPPGSYTVSASEISQPGPMWSRVRNLFGDWGSFRVPIHPLPSATVPGGRSGFFLHGGSRPGSAGCVDGGGGISGNDIRRRLLRDLRADPDGIVPLTVR